MKKIKTVAYLRCSTFHQDSNHQLQALKEGSANKNWEIVKVFSEVISGTIEAKERKEFSKLLNFLKDNPDIKIVQVRELSRLGRNALQIKQTIEDLTTRGVSVFIYNMGMQTLKEDGSKDMITSLILSILSELAEMERISIIERSKSGLRASAKKGKVGGGALQAFGYTGDSDGMLIIDKNEAETVKIIFDLLLGGMGTGRIADRLNDLKIRTKTSRIIDKYEEKKKVHKFKKHKWAGNTVLNILNRTDYYGKRKFTDLTLDCPAIISKETWDKAQLQLRQNYNENSRNTKHFYLLKGLLKCDCCGRNYTGRRRSDGSENYYHCSSRLRGVEACGNRGVGIHDLNTAVWFMLKYSNEVKGYAEKNFMDENIEDKVTFLKSQISKKETIINKIERDITKLIDLYMDGITTKEQVKVKIAKLEKELENVKRARRKLKTEILTIENTKAEGEKSKKVLEFIDMLDNSELKIQQILKSLLFKIVILNEPGRNGCGVSIYFKGVDYSARLPFSFWVDSKTKRCGLADVEEYYYEHCLLTF